jgi:hypothetical protein
MFATFIWLWSHREMCLTEGEIADMMQEGLTGMVEHHRTRMPMPISSDYIAYAWGLCLVPIERKVQ